jgi:catechol 2,3-dioxygenase-like lactoylglutathione lyase family enzyme
MFKKLTPVLIVHAIEPILPLWDALGFTRVAEVPHGDVLGFVILVRDGVEVMYQSLDSVRGDEPKVLEGGDRIGGAMLFIEVDDLDAVTKLVPPDADVVVRRRTTSYGATEMFIRDLAGNVIAFAQMST